MDNLAIASADLALHVGTSLIAVDFDGTLAPIIDDPEDARPVPGVIPALQTIAHAGATVALITGREARKVVDLSNADTVPGLLVAGVYGAEMLVDGELRVHPRPTNFDGLHRRLESMISELVPQSGVWVEDKRISLVVHVRRASDPVAALATLEAHAVGIANQFGVEIHTGKAVLEFRLPGFDKGRALAQLVELSQPTHILVAGDDRGDLAAFATVKDLVIEGSAWSVAVTDDARGEIGMAADLVVGSPEDFATFLVDLARAVTGRSTQPTDRRSTPI